MPRLEISPESREGARVFESQNALRGYHYSKPRVRKQVRDLVEEELAALDRCQSAVETGRAADAALEMNAAWEFEAKARFLVFELPRSALQKQSREKLMAYGNKPPAPGKRPRGRPRSVPRTP